MGLTFLEPKMGNPADSEKLETVELFVDSGVIDPVVPVPALGLSLDPLWPTLTPLPMLLASTRE